MRIAYHEKLSLGANEWISLSKPRKVFNVCYESTRDKVLPVEPFVPYDYGYAHDPVWVCEVILGRYPNGFGDNRKEVLEQVSYAHGAMYIASKAAIKHGVAFAPVSGFHHAGYDYNGGYCTFNGLLTTAGKLRSEGFDGKILILDFDGHWGDGTEDILKRRLPLLDCVEHMGRDRPFLTSRATDQALREIDLQRPGLVMLQAGADSINGDPFGVGYFTRQAWVLRDKLIFQQCKNLGIPVVWNLAGGYNGKETIMAHRETFCSAIEVFEGREALLDHRLDIQGSEEAQD